MKVLVLTKSRVDYSGNIIGLHNSANFLTDGLRFKGVEVENKRLADANEIDKWVTKFKPDLVVLEALWASATKLKELSKLHPLVNWVVRIHSNIPFLAMEGTAIEQIKELVDTPRVQVACNNQKTADYLTSSLQTHLVYLPNIYYKQDYTPEAKSNDNDSILDISCFGAIRPLKNQLIQTLAAINTADRLNKILHFHINSSRVEQAAEPILKNIRASFENTRHKLIEHDWLVHDKFLELVATMDVGLQVSFTESFNIVVADHIHVGVPVVVSHDIDWIPQECQVSTTDLRQISDKLVHVLKNKERNVKMNSICLTNDNQAALKQWSSFLSKL